MRLTLDMVGYQSNSAQNLLQRIRTVVDTGELTDIPGGAPFGVNFRTLGNVAYFMLSLNTPEALIRTLEHRIWDVLSTSQAQSSDEHIDEEEIDSSGEKHFIRPHVSRQAH